MAEVAVYVSTYGKYNSGSLKGRWLELKNYPNKEAFIEACKNLHSDEKNPEIMFQDYENIPQSLIGETWISDECWDILDWDEDSLEAFNYFANYYGEDANIEKFEQKYLGKYDNEESFAEEWFQQQGYLEKIPQEFHDIIDYERYSNILFSSGFWSSENKGDGCYVFMD